MTQPKPKLITKLEQQEQRINGQKKKEQMQNKKKLIRINRIEAKGYHYHY